MTSYLVLAGFLSIFYVAIATSLTKRGGKALSGQRTVLIGVCALLISWKSPAASLAYNGLVVILLYAVTFALLTKGVGNLIGSLLARMSARRRLQISLLSIIVVGPPIIGGAYIYKIEALKLAETSAQLATQDTFRQQILTGRFGSHTITFPAHPFLKVQYLCHNHSEYCYASWASAAIRGGDKNNLVVTELTYASEGRRRGAQADWCNENLRFASTAWCPPDSPFNVKLIDKDKNDISIENATGATLFEASEPIRTVACFEQFLGPRCIAVFDVAPGIEARFTFLGFTSQEAVVMALEREPFARDLWRSLSEEP